ncbi:glycosyltransferase family 4 protein [Flavobacterium tructae]|uniref:glycosyltransferase family 4 protein n=1 Tax=Flavobacterium tructae TaxID=1114873 RepID=UPI0025520BF2|nr:glycosyltransferase family 4 protein [Flavobacterium tructae]MDL2143367.1 glycosyltransferase family 4 protein [Flavobacterium tructae]
MHISFTTSHFPFYNAKSVGGIGTSIKNLSDELVSLGHQVTVFVYGQERDEKTIEEGITLFKIKNVKLKGLSWYLTRKKIQKKIIAEHKNSKIDILETPDWEGISSFINLPFPIVIRLNGSDTYFCHLDERKVKWINKFHEKRAIQKANGHLSVSQYTADLTNVLFGLEKPYTIIPNGIDINKFKKDTDYSTNKPLIEEKILLYFGGIIRKKGLLEIPHYFNKVIEEIPDVKLVLIGKDMSDKHSGNSSTFLMMNTLFSEEAKPRVSFLGSVPYQEIKTYIEKATVCIFPSYAEALPVSWLEAMSLEKAIVASDIGWSNEIIDHGINGFKVEPKRHEDYASCIIQIFKDDDLRKNIEIKAREKIVKNFSTSVTAQKTVQFYNEIILKNA